MSSMDVMFRQLCTTRTWRQTSCLFTVCLGLLTLQCLSPTLGNDDREIIWLGYITGSQKGPNSHRFYKKPGQSISGAMTLAVEEINNDSSILPNHKLDFVIAETHGQEEVSIKETVLLMERNISAYIGPQETCVHEARLAAAFNLPMISYFCTTHAVSNKELYPTFARTKPHDTQVSMSVVSLLQRFDWHKVAFVYTDEHSFLAETILKVLQINGIDVKFTKKYRGPYFPEPTANASPFIKIVEDTYQQIRVYVMLANLFEFEGLLSSLKMKGLLDTGEYIVVGVEPDQYDQSDPHKYVEGILSPSISPEVEAAFKGILVVIPAAPVYPKFDDFTNVVNYYLEAPPFNYINAFKKQGYLKKLRPEAAYLYDAVRVYATAADQAITDGGSPSDGRLILNYIKGTTYKSAMGYMTRIDENGDSQGNFTLLALKYKLPSIHRAGLYPVGAFMLNQNNTQVPTFQNLPGEDIDWIGGKPPADEPECGFDGEKCIPGSNYTPQTVGGVIGGLFFIITIVGVLAYRIWKYEQELASLFWKIDSKDICMQVPSYPYSCQKNRMSSGFRTSLVSLNSQVDLDLRQVFTVVGKYKGTVVAVKRLNKKYVDLTRNVRKELKMIRDVRHDNLNHFVGASVDAGNILIVTEYCAKGSLQDIIANDDFKLDDMFIAALVFDIIKGMTFLHDSDLRSHGKLKSSNCVVDSRWVLKIADYGLWDFKEGVEQDPDLSEHTFYQSLLWTAPELLRDLQPPRSGTQKGDIFSFAVILYELHGRCGPYGDLDASPKEIIHNVIRSDSDRPFRPRLSALGCVPKFVTDCITECWAENPALRPDFKTIRRMLKPLQKGMKPNIFDNMMTIMEKYATNLEDIVEERTDQLREEKKKTEELLHQMLPRSVAEQLKRGKCVEAEAFDSVTIYFSDICGFTAMSSESSPMQIVDLLNDLYTTFDSIIENYDVYKVETIGDAYMVVSGLPKRNGIQHAGEIASMSLHLLSTIKKSQIRHRPNDMLKLRIGIHSGTCVAGVVGLKMPRYCLFGDTVNTASRMESNGLPLRIHCSEASKELLLKLGGYQIEDRGVISMKGKGEMRTCWITGEDEKRRISRLKPPITTSTKSPKSPLTRSCRSPNMQKISSSPALQVHTENETNDVDAIETDKLLNGIVSHSPKNGLLNSPKQTLNPGLLNSPSQTLNSSKKDADWFSKGSFGRRSASVKVKFQKDIVPKFEPRPFGSNDTIWEKKEIEEKLQSFLQKGPDGFPLFHRNSIAGSAKTENEQLVRQSSGETSV